VVLRDGLRAPLSSPCRKRCWSPPRCLRPEGCERCMANALEDGLLTQTPCLREPCTFASGPRGSLAFGRRGAPIP